MKFIHISNFNNQWAIETDYHLHSSYTDGHDPVNDMVKECKNLDLKNIAFSEHSRKTSKGWFRSFKDNVKKSGKFFEIDVKVGTEVKIQDISGNLDLNKEIFSLSEFIMCSVHSLPKVFKNEFWSSKDLSHNFYNQVCDYEISLISNAVRKNKNIKKPLIVGHPFGTSIQKFNSFPNEDHWKQLAIICQYFDTKIEINSMYHNNLREILDILRCFDVFISIGSNSHSVEDINEKIKWVKGLKNKIWDENVAKK